MPFAYLLHQQPDTVLSLLENLTVPGPTGQPPQSALAVLLSRWCDYANDFQGYWNQKVFSVAMAQLYSLAAERPALQQVQVKGDLLLTEANTNKIMTRARARASESTADHNDKRGKRQCVDYVTSPSIFRSRPIPADPVPRQSAQAPAT